MSGSRRSFVTRACLAGACACVGSAFGPSAAPALEGGAEGAEGAEGARGARGAGVGQEPPALPRAWIETLLAGMAGSEAAEARRTLKGCAAAHWDALDMDATVARFPGDLPGFLGFLRSEWDWLVDHDPATGVVLVDENKERCVCPLVGGPAPGEAREDLGALCYCSEGFAERMFAAVTGAPARAEVTESILRGGTRCRYRIELGGRS